MSEVRSRPSAARGRGSGRGSRGGHSSRGGRPSNRQTNGDMADSIPASSLEEEGELGELKRMYSSKLSTIKEMFPNYTDEDIVFALQEMDGNLEATIDRISEGTISQWGEVKKKTKDRSQPKPRDPATTAADASHTSSRGGRGRGSVDGFRGRGRGSERARGTTRGGRGVSAAAEFRNTTFDKGSTDTAPIGDWDKDTTPDGVVGAPGQATETDNAALDSSWENINASEVAPTAASEPTKPSLKPDGTRTWASMFNRPAPPEVSKKSSKDAPSEEAASEQPSVPTSSAEELDMPGLPPPPPVENMNPNVPNTPPSPSMVSSEQAAELTPPKDELTETNLEQVLDTSGPPNSGTAASTVASTIDHRMGSGTPMQPTAQSGTSRPPLGGYATSAYKATGMPGRSASFQRRVLEQREAVVMPGKHAVDRAAVQFGSMGLNGSSEDLDVDDDREEPETRGQPPQHSPIAPKATLPPPGQGTQSLVSESLTAPRQAPGLPPPNQQASQHPMQSLESDRNVSQQPSQPSYPYNQFSGGFGHQPTPREQSAPTQKPYEPFGSQIQQPQHPFDGYSATSQGPPPSQQHAPSQPGGLSSAPHDLSSYYTSDSQRNAYQNYYANYGQQSQQNQHDAGHAQHRTPSAFGTSAPEQTAQHATSQPPQQPPSRYGQVIDPQGSGSSTPNPSLPGQGQPNQPPHLLQQQQQPQGQSGGQHAGYPYGHPYYPSPYYQAYLNQVSHHAFGRDRPMYDDARRFDDQFLTQNGQFGYGGSQGGYGAPFAGGAGKQGGIYSQPPGYGMSPQASYDQHASSPAAHGAFGQQPSAPTRDGAASAHMSSYNRTGSTQPSEHQQQYPGGASAGYGGISEAFGRTGSAFSGPNHGLGHQQAGQPGSNDDSLRGYVDSAKMAGGPSPAPGMRPGSAVNNMQGQSGLPPSQSAGQQGYGGYPSHLNHQMHGQQGTQYGAGPGGHHQSVGQGHQSGGYGGPYGGGFGSSYYSNNRGGWGSNYGH
ncbi:MAG: hypothetical protein LQ337_004704 [Flavoplaca oasis]|nr:MAG: hypothetical protein LQ337_004704 [Flavoplaca oasis]